MAYLKEGITAFLFACKKAQKELNELLLSWAIVKYSRRILSPGRCRRI